jgi:hypothetical protein
MSAPALEEPFPAGPEGPDPVPDAPAPEPDMDADDDDDPSSTPDPTAPTVPIATAMVSTPMTACLRMYAPVEDARPALCGPYDLSFGAAASPGLAGRRRNLPQLRKFL